MASRFIPNMYKKIIDVNGVIMEFGVRWGQNLSLLAAVRAMFEPYNVKRKIIGIKISPLNNEFNKQKLGPTKAIYYAVGETWFVTKTTLKFVGSMFQGRGDSSQIGGPIRIAKITGQVAQFGIIAFLSIMAYISISLGLINLFPIPMLDGGHLMFYAFEKVLGRPLSQKTQEGFFRIGMFLLVSLMFFTTFNDLKDLGLFN